MSWGQMMDWGSMNHGLGGMLSGLSHTPFGWSFTEARTIEAGHSQCMNFTWQNQLEPIL